MDNGIVYSLACIFIYIFVFSLIINVIQGDFFILFFFFYRTDRWFSKNIPFLTKQLLIILYYYFINVFCLKLGIRLRTRDLILLTLEMHKLYTYKDYTSVKCKWSVEFRIIDLGVRDVQLSIGDRCGLYESIIPNRNCYSKSS